MNSTRAGVLTMIMAGGRGERLYPLTRDAAKPAVTIAGCYRIIDFTLSNCFNSGMRQLYLLTQYSNVTMNRHLRLAWEPIFLPDQDEFVESVPPQHRSGEDWYHGTADSIYQNISILQRHRPEYVLVLSGDHVYRMNYTGMIEYHVENGAELTIAAVEIEREQASSFGVMGIDPDGCVRLFVEKPGNPPACPGNPEMSLCSMGVYVFSTTKLVRELIRDAKDRRSSHDFGKSIIPALIERGDRVFAYPFRDDSTGATGYWRDIGTLDSYFACNLDLASPRPGIDLYDKSWPIRTRTQPHPPSRVVGTTAGGARSGEVVDSLLGPGCVISGARVEQSVLSPEVRIHGGAEVSQCVLMEGVEVGCGVTLRKTIVCPGVQIPEGKRIGVDGRADRARYTVSQGGITVVPSEFTW
jgi:glucose-1-phosphate adenylyltransferase